MAPQKTTILLLLILFFPFNANSLIISGPGTITLSKTRIVPFTLVNNEETQLFVDLSFSSPPETGIITPKSLSLKPGEKRAINLEVSNYEKKPGEKEIVSIIARTEYGSQIKKIMLEFPEKQKESKDLNKSSPADLNAENTQLFHQGLISFIEKEAGQTTTPDLILTITVIVLALFFLRQVR